MQPKAIKQRNNIHIYIRGICLKEFFRSWYSGLRYPGKRQLSMQRPGGRVPNSYQCLKQNLRIWNGSKSCFDWDVFQYLADTKWELKVERVCVNLGLWEMVRPELINWKAICISSCLMMQVWLGSPKDQIAKENHRTLKSQYPSTLCGLDTK